jgi:putative Mg2+ transporter-C (MgtC) family protein
MTPMPIALHWSDAALRLALTLLAGIALGFNRSEHGKAAGMVTVVLVCLAASVAMLQMNALLSIVGRSSDSFVMNDLMRLPLGILTGVGFIGGGAILHRQNLVTGVTTAATLWLATVIGLCLGGGQIELGVTATALALTALWLLKWIENRLPREAHASISIEADSDGPDEPTLRRDLAAAKLRVVNVRVLLDKASGRRAFSFEVCYKQRSPGTDMSLMIDRVASHTGIRKVEWTPES